MNLTPAIQSHIKIDQLINSSRLHEAFLLIKKGIYLPEIPNHEREKILAAETTYKYLLNFMADGIEDPSKENNISEIKESLYRINDIIFRASIIADSSDSYSSAKRLFIHKKTTLNLLFDNYISLLKENDSDNDEKENLTSSQLSVLNDIFNYIWTIFSSSHIEYELLGEMLKNKDIPVYARSLIISAILLGNISYFDTDAYSLLLDLLDSESSKELKVRAATAIILITFAHPKRIENNVQIRSRLLIMKEDDAVRELFNQIIIELVRTYDTKRISSKMTNEVIPGLMKIDPKIIEKMRNISMESDNFLSDSNPDWEELIEESGIKDKIQEINDMQIEGADVMLTTFSNLKSFPFFNQISNWFLPFISSHPEIAGLISNSQSIDFSNLRLAMCDSDMYSFLLSISGMPQIQAEGMLKNMNMQMQQAKEMLSSVVGEDETKRARREIRHYLQDIYRFFKLYKKKSDFLDPFAKALSANALNEIIAILGIDHETIRIVSEFYFKHQYFQEAAEVYELLTRLNPEDFSIWEKLAFCYDKLKNYDEAINWYRKAELMNPESMWLLKKIAVCLRNAGKFKESISYYEKVIANEPENYHLLMSSAQCYLEASEYTAALQNFRHAAYLKSEKIDPIRGIAWTLLNADQLEEASNTYRNMLKSEDVDLSDYLNAALCEMALKNFKDAITYYNTYLSKTGNDFRALITSFKEDSVILKKLGIKTPSLRLIIDKLRYDLIG